MCEWGSIFTTVLGMTVIALVHLSLAFFGSRGVGFTPTEVLFKNFPKAVIFLWSSEVRQRNSSKV